jgi:hypothetical protein
LRPPLPGLTQCRHHRDPATRCCRVFWGLSSC